VALPCLKIKIQPTTNEQENATNGVTKGNRKSNLESKSRIRKYSSSFKLRMTILKSDERASKQF
jgi:hypothetical protein